MTNKKTNEEIIDELRDRFDIHTNQEYLKEPPEAWELEEFILKALQAKDEQNAKQARLEKIELVESMPTIKKVFDLVKDKFPPMLSPSEQMDMEATVSHALGVNIEKWKQEQLNNLNNG